jgi:GNAT superfamily N-acetyltransferase
MELNAHRSDHALRATVAGAHTSECDSRPPDGAGGVRLRRMGLHDLPFVVEQHTSCFPEGFFARLGPRFLTRYYRTFLDGPLSTALVAELDGTVCGYLAGVLEPRHHRRLLLTHHGRSLAASACLGLAVRPRLAFTFVVTRGRRYYTAWVRDRGKTSEGLPMLDSVAILTHVAVTPPSRGAGAGTALVHRFLEEARTAGRADACLVTLAGPAGAGSFYERRGWACTAERRAEDGRYLRYYRIRL